MERFDPLTGVWCSCPAMNTRRRYCRIAVVGKTTLNSGANFSSNLLYFAENSIYALGGFDSTNYQASVERYDNVIAAFLIINITCLKGTSQTFFIEVSI